MCLYPPSVNGNDYVYEDVSYGTSHYLTNDYDYQEDYDEKNHDTNMKNMKRNFVLINSRCVSDLTTFYRFML